MEVNNKHQNNQSKENKKDSLKLVRQIVSSLKFLNYPSAKQYATLAEITSSSDVTNDDISEIFRKYRSNLKLASLNVGYNVMANTLTGSEAPQVAICQQAYQQNEGWHNSKRNLASCSYNSAIFLSDYKLFGLQEVNRSLQKPFQDAIIHAGQQKGRDYQFISSYYFGEFGIVIGYDRNEMGPGIQITPNNYVFGDPGDKDIRGIQAVFFPVRNLLAINVHAPHYIDLVYHLNANFAYIGKLLMQSEAGKSANLKETRVIVTGDFNDFKGLLIEPTIEGKLTILGKVLMMHIKAIEDVPISCCTDTNYKYVGDYIFDSHNNNEKNYYYGLPLGYDRRINLLSDHDPVVLIEVDDLKGKSFTGIIVIVGSYVEIRLKDLDEDMLFDLAKVYLKRNGIDWRVHKPFAWSVYHGHKKNGGPHVTLSSAMAKYQGQEVQVELGDIYTYVSGNARWVMISAVLPSKLKCEYECHMSLAEQRLK